MPREELAHEIRQGVVFWGLEEVSVLLGVMGLQPAKDVTLIRHAYVANARRGEGIGGKLLDHLLQTTVGRILVERGRRQSGRSGSTRTTVSVGLPLPRKTGCCGSTGQSRSGRWRPRSCWSAANG